MQKYSDTFTAINGISEATVGNTIDLTNKPAKEIYMQVEGIVSATVGLKGSLDNSTFYDMSLQEIDTTDSTTYVGEVTADGLTKSLIVPRFIRPETTAYASGTVVATLHLRY